LEVKDFDGEGKDKSKEEKNFLRKNVDEQNSDGSGGAFEEFVDQRSDE
jgi:hypothetical protein